MRLDDAPAVAAEAGGRTGGAPALRIVHCFRAPTGGLFRHIRDLAEAAAAAGDMVGIICDSAASGALDEQALAAASVHLALGVTRTPMRRQVAPSDIAATWRLLKHIRSLAPDILHGHGAKGGAYARIIGTLLRASGLRVARIYTPHGGSLHYDRGSLAGRAYFLAERILGRMTDAFIFVSRYEADLYADKVGRPGKPATVILNGLHPDEFEPVTAAPDARDFLYIGELRDLKGPDVFIAALARMGSALGRPATAVIVGSGRDKPRYQAMVTELGLSDAIVFRDPMPAREAFALATTVVVPSRAESMPYIVLEAIAANLPIIATRVGGIPEIVGTDASLLVPPGDAEALATAMASVVSDLDNARRMGQRLRDGVRAHFALAPMAEAVTAVYRDAVAH